MKRFEKMLKHIGMKVVYKTKQTSNCLRNLIDKTESTISPESQK